MFFLERTITPEERIKRAEEIYNRRKMQNIGVRVTSTAVNTGTNPDISLFKKMILQILICIVIYFIFYLIQNTNYIFSEDIINKTKEILSYDINFESLYNRVNTYINDFKVQYQNMNMEPNNIEKNDTEQNTTGDNMLEQENNNQISNVTEENIGGAESLDNNEQVEQEVKENNGNLSQMEIDANDIKSKYTLIKPLEGTVTSRFGLRNPTTPTVPKNHTGIDIAANIGTVIYAALDGTVEISSSEGDYGKHLKIVKDDVAIIYAHCSKLYLKQGDVIKQGDAIAEVGATGNVTGPHLHFEIRKQGRYVNPDYIMQF